MAETTPKSNATLRLDAVWVAEQFARIGVTLDYLKASMERQSEKEAAQDAVIDGLRRDISEMKADLRALKEDKPPKVNSFAVITALVALAGFLLSLLNQLYLPQ
jgi:hypothetical protein